MQKKNTKALISPEQYKEIEQFDIYAVPADWSIAEKHFEA